MSASDKTTQVAANKCCIANLKSCRERFSKDTFMRWISDPQVWGFFVSMAVLLVVSIAFFLPNNFAGDTLSQSDQVQGAANGAEAQAYEEATGEKALWTNSLFGGMPTFQISPSYESNSLFDWLNSVYGLGLPVPSNLLFMMMFGFLIMCYCWRMRWWYALIGSLAWGLSSYFIIIIGAGHIWKFVALAYMPPMIGAIAMAYRGRWFSGAALLGIFAMLQLNANHPQITYYAAFIIVALVIAWFIDAIRTKKYSTWFKASGACLLAGTLAIGANSPSLYNTYEYSKETKRSASELTPLKAETQRTDEMGIPIEAEKPTGGLPKGEIGGWSNTPSETMTLLIPNAKGGASARLVGGKMQSMPLYEAPGIQQSMIDNDPFQLLQQLPQYFGGKMDSGGTNGPFYFGALICALFLLGCFIVKGPEKWALLIVSIFSALLAMGNHFEALTDWMIYNFPMYNKFRAAETTLVIAAMCVPLLAMLGLQKLLSTPNALQRYKNDLIAALGFPLILCFIAWVWPSFFGEPLSFDEQKMFEQAMQTYSDPQAIDALQTTIDNIKEVRLDLVSQDALRSMLILIAGGILVLLTANKMISKVMGLLGIGAIILFDLYTVGKRYVSTESFVTSYADFEDPLAPDDIDNEILKDTGYYRVLDLDRFGSPDRSAHHHMIGGYHAAKLNRYNDLIDRNAITIPGVLDMLNTRYVIYQGKVENYGGDMGPAWLADSLVFVDNADAEMAAITAEEIIEMPVAINNDDSIAGDSIQMQEIAQPTFDPRATTLVDKRYATSLGTEQPSLTQGDSIYMTEYTPNRLKYNVTTANGGVAVFSEIYFPWGWEATIDGNEVPISRVNYILRAIRVPAGKHEIVMSFNPQSIHVTTSIAYASVTLIYLLALMALFFFIMRRENAAAPNVEKDNTDVAQ